MKRAGLVVCFLTAACSLAVACASLPKPEVVAEADRVARTPAAKEAESLAPQAHAHADALRRRADDLYRAGDLAGAQIVGEHAIAAMQRAFILARLVKAQKRLDAANAKLSDAQAKLAELDEQAQRITAEADNLELRLKVLQDAEPLAPNTPASPERERARKQAARALLTQARLLCLATRLLEPGRDKLGELLATVDRQEQALGSQATVDVNQVTKARSDCLRELTLVRRPELLAAPAQGVSDALLEQLTKTERFFAFRDDRGVVVVLRNVMGKGNSLTPESSQQLEALARVAKAHPKFPVLVVLHSSRDVPGAAANENTKLAALVAHLKQAGAPSVEGYAAGAAQPIAHPKQTGAAERNERIEIVFVSPAP